MYPCFRTSGDVDKFCAPPKFDQVTLHIMNGKPVWSKGFDPIEDACIIAHVNTWMDVWEVVRKNVQHPGFRAHDTL